MKLPSPVSGELTLYFVGPGFGESTVLVLPDGAVVVIDCCSIGKTCLTLDLVNQLGGEIDLLIVTHPDLDHVSGLDKLVTGTTINRAWLYPHLSLVRSFLGRWGGGTPSIRKLEAAWVALDELRDDNAAVTVAYGYETWSRAGVDLTVLAPLASDMLKAERELRRMVEWKKGKKPELSMTMVKRLLGTARPGDHPNLVSLAIAGGAFTSWRCLLGGDLEAPTAPNRGWNGVLQVLQRDGRMGLVEDLDLVKVCHHGSNGAWCGAAWAAHTNGGTRKVPISVVTPFNKGKNPPPHSSVLSELRTHTAQLAVSTNKIDTRVLAAGWTLQSRAAGDDMVVVRLANTGATQVHTHGMAGLFD